MFNKKLTRDQTTSIPLLFGVILLFWLFSVYIETGDIRYLVVYSLGSCKLTFGIATYQSLCTENPNKVNLWRASYYVLIRIV